MTSLSRSANTSTASAEREFCQTLIAYLHEPEEVLAVWRVLDEAAQQRALSFLLGSLDDPALFLEAEDLMTLLVPHANDKLREWIVSVLCHIRDSTKFSETRRSALSILMQTGQL